MSRYDLTNRKFSPDSETNIADPPNDIVETKYKGEINIVDILSAKIIIVNWHTVIFQGQFGLEMLLGHGVEKE